jgi:hypothetical protein
MHYKNGREAKQGDKIVLVRTDPLVAPLSGILYNVNAQSDSCNGRVAVCSGDDTYVNIKDCLHVEDVASATIPDSRPQIAPAPAA